MQRGERPAIVEHALDAQGKGRAAALIGLVLLAVLQAGDLLVTNALLAKDGSELNPLGRALLGSGGAALAKFGILALLTAVVIHRRVTRLGLVCAVWAVTGIYVGVVAMNVYSLHLLGGL
jgi:hypothetical protein